MHNVIEVSINNDHPNSIVVGNKEDRAVGRSENPGDGQVVNT